MGVKGEKIKPDDIRMWVEIAVYPYLRKLDVSYSSVKRKHGSQQLVYLQNACDLETVNQNMPFHLYNIILLSSVFVIRLL